MHDLPLISRRPAIPVGILLIILLALLPSPAASQVVRGKIIDTSSRAPIRAVEVILIDATTDRVRRGMVTTDSLGAFQIRAPLPGKYTLELRRLGFSPQSTRTFDVGSGETIVLELMMSSTQLKFDTLVVVQRSVGPSSMVLRFRERAAWTERTGRGRVYYADDLRGLGSVEPLYHLYGKSRDCPMTILVDNLPIPDPRDLDHLADISLIEGVEIYRSHHSIPEEFQHHRACSLMLVWTNQLGGNKFSWLRLIVGTALGAALFFLNR